MHYDTLILEKVPSLFNRPERDECSAETQGVYRKDDYSLYREAVLFRLSGGTIVEAWNVRNTLHAEIIYTSPFINVEIKFISLMYSEISHLLRTALQTKPISKLFEASTSALCETWKLLVSCVLRV